MRRQPSAAVRASQVEVRQVERAGEVETPQQPAVAVGVQLESNALSVDLADQQPAIGQPRQVHRGQGRGPGQAGKDALALSTSTSCRRQDLQLPAIGDHRHRPRGCGQPIGAEVDALNDGRAFEGPGLEVSRKQPLGAAGPQGRAGRDPGQRGRGDEEGQPLGGAQRRRIGRALRHHNEVPRLELAGDAIEAASGPPPRHCEDHLGSRHADVGRRQAGCSKGRPA